MLCKLERRLSVSAAIACRLRGAIREQLGEKDATPSLWAALTRACMHSISMPVPDELVLLS